MILSFARLAETERRLLDIDALLDIGSSAPTSASSGEQPAADMRAPDVAELVSMEPRATHPKGVSRMKGRP